MEQIDNDSVIITAYLRQPMVQQLPDIKGSFIFAGKKTDSNLPEMPADLSNKISRQIFAKIPGFSCMGYPASPF
jgi:Fe(3+) dicitrate transport protein